MINRNEAISRIRKALKARSGKAWSVRGGRGTAWGWIDVDAPPRRRNEHHLMSDDDRAELAGLFGLDAAHHQGLAISPDARDDYVARAETTTPGYRPETDGAAGMPHKYPENHRPLAERRATTENIADLPQELAKANDRVDILRAILATLLDAIASDPVTAISPDHPISKAVHDAARVLDATS